MIDKFPVSVLSDESDTTQAKLWKLFERQYEKISNTFESIYLLLDIEKNEGMNLDRLGVLLGEARKGKQDSIYRKFLKIAVIKLISKGDIYTLNSIAFILDYTDLNIEEVYPAKIRIRKQDSILNLSPDTVLSFIFNSVRAGGVGCIIEYIFIINEAICSIPVSMSLLLDSAWILDGRKILNPVEVEYNSDEVIFYYNEMEIFRKNTRIYYEGNTRIHEAVLEKYECIEKLINKAVLCFDNRIVMDISFDIKEKDRFTTLIFRFMEVFSGI